MIGAILACASIIGIKKYFVEDRLEPSFQFTAFIGWDAVWVVVPILLLAGVGLSALASFLTLRRYLRV